MSDIESSDWSETAASNNATPPAGWPEGMAPSAVNDAAREMMGAIKREWNRSHGAITTAGTGTAYTLAYTTAPDAYVNAAEYGAKVHTDNTGSATANVNSLGAKTIKKMTSSGLSDLAAGDLQADHHILLKYDSGADVMVLMSPSMPGDSSITLAMLANEAREETIGIMAIPSGVTIAAGTGIFTFFMPFAMTVTEVGAGVITQQSSGSILTFDIKETGISMLSTKITIDNAENTSLTAATPPVISDAALAKGSAIAIDCVQIGNGTAKGLFVWISGYRT